MLQPASSATSTSSVASLTSVAPHFLRNSLPPPKVAVPRMSAGSSGPSRQACDIPLCSFPDEQAPLRSAAAGSCSTSTDLDHDPPADLALEDGAAGLDDLVEADRRRHGGELLRIEVAGEAAPGFEPQRLWR